MVCGRTIVLTAPSSSTLQHWTIQSYGRWYIGYLQVTAWTSSMQTRQHMLDTGILLVWALWIPTQYASVLQKAGGPTTHDKKWQRVLAGWKCSLLLAGDETLLWASPHFVLFLVSHHILAMYSRLTKWAGEEPACLKCPDALLDKGAKLWLTEHCMVVIAFCHLPYNYSECVHVCVCVRARVRGERFLTLLPCKSRFLFLIVNIPNTVLNFIAIQKFLDVMPYDLVDEYLINHVTWHHICCKSLKLWWNNF
jgi:hypothetical protein